jgi:UDPglucose--hexose-1-phosphate uridylyltransferase
MNFSGLKMEFNPMKHELNLQQHSHRRYNRLTRQWILVAPHRAQRPWQGQIEGIAQENRPEYDPDCYLCPGNIRSNGEKNPVYAGTFVFTNDFSSLLPEFPGDDFNESDLLIARSERGDCRVLCFSPRHNLTLPEMEIGDIEKVVAAWTNETLHLGAKPHNNYVVIFENKGALMGCSNPHPHCQIWGSEQLPRELALELDSCRDYWRSKNRCLLCDYLELELKKQERIICENEDFVVLVPFWALWPFETLLISKRHLGSLLEMTDREKHGLADILKQITIRYDNLFQTSFPYSMGFHQAPTDNAPHPDWHFHAHYFPPLLRSATVRKFMVGFEMLGTPMRDISPEIAAQRLREMPGEHYLTGLK